MEIAAAGPLQAEVAAHEVGDRKHVLRMAIAIAAGQRAASRGRAGGRRARSRGCRKCWCRSAPRCAARRTGCAPARPRPRSRPVAAPVARGGCCGSRTPPGGPVTAPLRGRRRARSRYRGARRRNRWDAARSGIRAAAKVASQPSPASLRRHNLSLGGSTANGDASSRLQSIDNAARFGNGRGTVRQHFRMQVSECPATSVFSGARAAVKPFGTESENEAPSGRRRRVGGRRRRSGSRPPSTSAAFATSALDPLSWPYVGSALDRESHRLGRGAMLPRSGMLGPNLRRLPSDGLPREIALTFDDGPDPAVTPRVLDLLDAPWRQGDVLLHRPRRRLQIPISCAKCAARPLYREPQRPTSPRLSRYMAPRRLRQRYPGGAGYARRDHRRPPSSARPWVFVIPSDRCSLRLGLPVCPGRGAASIPWTGMQRGALPAARGCARRHPAAARRQRAHQARRVSDRGVRIARALERIPQPDCEPVTLDAAAMMTAQSRSNARPRNATCW